MIRSERLTSYFSGKWVTIDQADDMWDTLSVGFTSAMGF
jgi:hypothetical protein